MYFPAAVSRLSARGLETMGGGSQEDKGTLHLAEEGTCASILECLCVQKYFTHYSIGVCSWAEGAYGLGLSL